MQIEAAVLGEMVGEIWNVVMCWLLFVAFQKDPREGGELKLLPLSTRAVGATKYSFAMEVFCL